ncbi:MAG: hypothetical protein NZ602_14570 [Thermoguttaceae bacterium]|nr:hypothetical protein [Thermoguttaceae bacterium]MDW8036523.1 hypothetical protein [Thermoguttaceae bacterium]
MSNLVGSAVLFGQLKPGDLVEVVQRVTVGMQSWTVSVRGQVLWTERRAQGLHFPRTPDEKTYCDLIVLEKSDGERTTVCLDEFTQIYRLDNS